MEFCGIEFDLLPAPRGGKPKETNKDSHRIKDNKAWLAGELIVRCEHQELSQLPPQLFRKTTVQKLILTGNALDHLPLQLFSHLKSLQELSLGFNQLSCLPDSVEQLHHLRLLDLQYNCLQELPAALCKCVQLQVVNLDGNPLSSTLREMWPESASSGPGPAAGAAAGAAAASASTSSRAITQQAAGPKQQQQQRQQQQAGQPDAGVHRPAVNKWQRLRQNTRVLLEHLQQQLDPDTVAGIKQAKLKQTQQASRSRIKLLLKVADLDSLDECKALAAQAYLGQEVLGHVQEVQDAATELQQVLNQVQHLVQVPPPPQGDQQQQQHAASAAAAGGKGSSCQVVEASDTGAAYQQLGAALKKLEQLSKPGRPTGNLYAAAHAAWRQLQRQQLEHGWRSSSAQQEAGMSAGALPAAGMDCATGSGCHDVAAATAGNAHDDHGPGSGSGGGGGSEPRRFLTASECRRQALAAGGAMSHAEWSRQKQQREERQRRHLQELIVAEHEQMLMSIADRAEQALEAARRETAWPSRRVEAYPPGTFNLPPNELKAVRRAHHNRGGGL